MQLDFTALLNKAKDAGWITECESGFLKWEHPRMAAFYILPEIHKEPIVSANGTLTEPASQNIDYFLKPFVHELPSYVQDVLINQELVK